jgi:hypothetical protein
MKTKEDVENLEKLIEQLQGLHVEITQLVKKSPNDALNLFKLRLVNNVLTRANGILMGEYRPFDDFSQFEEDSLPTNSDVTMILAQYMGQAERYRSHHITWHLAEWRMCSTVHQAAFKVGPQLGSGLITSSRW